MNPIRKTAALLALAGLALVALGCTLLNGAPLASFTLSPSSGAAPLLVQVDATSSFDPDGDVLTYVWDFGDGAVGSGALATHTYASAGVYTISLSVMDPSGREGIASRAVVVNELGESPIASFTASPSSGGTPLTVAFNAAASTDPNGSVVSYVWSFGDGTTGTGSSPIHTYTVQGTYSAMLTVTDNDGLTDTMTLQILVIDGGQGGCR